MKLLVKKNNKVSVVITALNIIILFLGIIQPSSLWIILANSFIFGFLLKVTIVKQDIKKNILLIISALLYGLVIYLKSANINYFCTAVLSIILASFLGRLFIRNPKKIIIIGLTLMILGFGLVEATEGSSIRQLFSIEPTDNYNSDASTYIKVVYLMKGGEGFYQSLAEVTKTQFGQYPIEIWGWRQPFLFYLWKIFPGDGRSIIYLGLIVLSLNLIAAYFIGRKFLSSIEALLCPYIIWPYLHYPLIEKTIAQVEWWALSAFIWGFTFLLYNKRWLAGLFFAICLSIRELFLISILSLVVIDFWLKDIKQTIKLIIPTLFLILPFYLFIHTLNISKYQNISQLINNSARQSVSSGWIYIRPTLSYNSWSYLFQDLRPFLILLILNSCLLMLIIKVSKKSKKNLILMAFLLGSFLPFFLASLRIGTFDLWHDYWGIYYVPLLLLATPIVFNNINELFKTKN